MDTEAAEAVPGVLRATADDDLDALTADAVASTCHLAICSLGAAPTDAVLRQAGTILDADRGLASVSLLDRAGIARLEGGDDGRPLSDQMTTTSLNEALRRVGMPPLSIANASGAVVVLSHHALSRIPALPPGASLSDRLDAWSASAGFRALTHLLDTSAIVERRGTVNEPERPLGRPLATADDPALDHARLRVRAALRGLRVHIDGRTLEAAETGTEVHTLQLIGSLARRPEVSYVGVNLRGSVPSYAADMLRDPRVHVIEGCGEWNPDLPRVDVFHRPYQPLSRADSDRWRTIGARTACHMQDLITFLSPQYHPSVDDWRRWRTDVSQAVAAVDGVFTLSEYVRQQVLREGMRGEPDLVWAAPCGVDHAFAAAPPQPPPELTGTLRPFALVLGSSYGHKNVDLAQAAVDAARAAGCDIGLVTAGRQVAGTSGRVAASTSGAVHLARNVSSAERNWLLANAAVVVFATSAEGFGLVPFEAAAYGTPTVCVTFGALAEHLGDLPVDTPDWSVAAFSRAIQQIVTDHDAASSQVAAIRRAGTQLTWDRTAATVLTGYREILRRPARG